MMAIRSYTSRLKMKSPSWKGWRRRRRSNQRVAGRNKDKGPRHVRICHYMMDSQAWKSLGAVERAIYLDMAKRYAGVGSNNGRIGYSVRTAATELHVGTSTAKRGLDTLQERGFIVVMK